MAILRKIRERLAGITQKKKKSRTDKAAPSETKAAKEVLGASEMAVEKTKFYAPQAPQPEAAMVSPPRIMQELPFGYGQDKIVLQTRDPWWLHAYWEVRPQTLDRIKEQLGNSFFGAKMILKVYDVSNIIFDGNNAHRFFDIEINSLLNNWYIDTAGPGRSWCVDIGLRLASGEFIKIARSNTVNTPLDGPSWITDEEWMIPEDMFARLYGMGFGLGKSSPLGKAWQERVKRELFFVSSGIASMASPVKKLPKERKFWLVVNTELIVYGATEPDAKVCVQGREIRLRPDGTFTLRFALPDGKQVIPVQATSQDKLEEKTITPIVTKETK
jgi:hypothetical protein